MTNEPIVHHHQLASTHLCFNSTSPISLAFRRALVNPIILPHSALYGHSSLGTYSPREAKRRGTKRSTHRVLCMTMYYARLFYFRNLSLRFCYSFIIFSSLQSLPTCCILSHSPWSPCALHAIHYLSSCRKWFLCPSPPVPVDSNSRNLLQPGERTVCPALPSARKVDILSKMLSVIVFLVS
jgi:hypothetical protein